MLEAQNTLVSILNPTVLTWTDVMAAQAGQLDHLDDIGPPPASKMRKRSSWEAGEAAFLPGTMLSDFLLNRPSATQSSHWMRSYEGARSL